MQQTPSRFSILPWDRVETDDLPVGAVRACRAPEALAEKMLVFVSLKRFGQPSTIETPDGTSRPKEIAS
jgi:hypothetical protein